MTSAEMDIEAKLEDDDVEVNVVELETIPEVFELVLDGEVGEVGLARAFQNRTMFRKFKRKFHKNIPLETI